MDRVTAIKVLDKQQQNTAIITGLNGQYRKVERTIKKHWPILFRDTTLGKLLSKNPSLLIKEPQHCRLRLYIIYQTPPKKYSHVLWPKTFFWLKRFKACKTVKNKERKRIEFKSNHSKKLYKIDKFVSCDSTHVIYILACLRGLQYVGRMARKLTTRINERINNNAKVFKKQCFQ